MTTTQGRKTNRAYPCPNPVRGGCGCPQSSRRCYGDIRGMREDYTNLVASGYSRERAAEVASIGVGRRWSPEEILDRF